MSSERIVTLLPSLVERIETCWHPSHFREVLKSIRGAFKAVEYMMVMKARLQLVIDLKPDFEVLGTLQEILEDLDEEIENFDSNKSEKRFKTHENKLRILVAKKSEKTNLLGEKKPVDSFQELTLQVYHECNRDLHKSAERLGISAGLVAQRVIRYQGKL